MTITLEIKPELQTELARLAAARGMGIDAFATAVLEEAAAVSGKSERLPAKDMVDLFAPLRGLNLDFERDQDPGRDIEL